jgi:hypothetical protein
MRHVVSFLSVGKVYIIVNIIKKEKKLTQAGGSRREEKNSYLTRNTKRGARPFVLVMMRRVVLSFLSVGEKST